ncbi:MAG: 2,3,4,5-tetrahydropyridine-2,6-dicarboxylate N-acetyltransferase [Desulfuromonas sp. SDB]|nr:MAG: 2,3,4,5-tetrahydropyridine-2,6-dicarboxylate N-acetyltransferase [Desulfuromonas sp. SDB]
MDAEQIIKLISSSPKKTRVKLYISGRLDKVRFDKVKYFGNKFFGMAVGEWKEISRILADNAEVIFDYELEINSRNSAIPLADLTRYQARIEPGAVIREGVEIGKGVVVMMGAVINIGAEIGAGTMIDMNAVVGGRAIIGKDCHIGAGAVIAGVIEPPSAVPVVIEDRVLIGANAVILEGITVGEQSVVAAGAVVIEKVPPHSVVAGVPAKVIKMVDEKTAGKSKIVNALRNLNE